MSKLPRNVLSVTVDANGVKTTVYKPRKAPKGKMVGKTSRGYTVGTSGFAMGYARSTAGFRVE